MYPNNYCEPCNEESTPPVEVPPPPACVDGEPCYTILDARCVKYTGDDLDNIDVSTDDRLDTILGKIDEKIDDLGANPVIHQEIRTALLEIDDAQAPQVIFVKTYAAAADIKPGVYEIDILGSVLTPSAHDLEFTVNIGATAALSFTVDLNDTVLDEPGFRLKVFITIRSIAAATTATVSVHAICDVSPHGTVPAGVHIQENVPTVACTISAVYKIEVTCNFADTDPGNNLLYIHQGFIKFTETA